MLGGMRVIDVVYDAHHQLSVVSSGRRYANPDDGLATVSVSPSGGRETAVNRPLWEHFESYLLSLSVGPSVKRRRQRH